MDNHGRLGPEDFETREEWEDFYKRGRHMVRDKTGHYHQMVRDETNTKWERLIAADKREREFFDGVLQHAKESGTRPQLELSNGTPLKETQGILGRLWAGTVSNFVGGKVAMFISRPVRIPFTQYSAAIHKFVSPDAPACYHTHPYKAWRLILWSGYVEEVYDPSDLCCSGFDRWHFLRCGFIRPEFCHRVDRLLGKASYSLWIYGPRTHEVQLIGDGWQNQKAS